MDVQVLDFQSRDLASGLGLSLLGVGFTALGCGL